MLPNSRCEQTTDYAPQGSAGLFKPVGALKRGLDRESETLMACPVA